MVRPDDSELAGLSAAKAKRSDTCSPCGSTTRKTSPFFMRKPHPDWGAMRCKHCDVERSPVGMAMALMRIRNGLGTDIRRGRDRSTAEPRTLHQIVPVPD